MDSFGTMVDLKRIKCIRCKTSNCVQKKDIAWRPMICHDTVTWVLHNRLKCKDCGGSFASIDPDFLSQPPTRVVEQFLFVARKYGPGIHQSLVLQFVALVRKGIMHGSFVKSINEVLRINHSMDMISYYDSVSEKMKGCDRLNRELGFAPRVFASLAILILLAVTVALN